MYPDAELPDGFPLTREQAIYPDRALDPAAEEWLRRIAIMEELGSGDLARHELDRFLQRYPDYALPGWFPLSPNDVLPADR